VSAGNQLIGVRQAGKLLAINGGVITGVAHVKRVSMAQIEEWQARPPGWLLNAQARKRRSVARRDKRRRQAAARRKRRADDQRLCSPAVVELLGLSSGRVAGAMRAAGVSTPLDEPTVTGWLSSCARPMPAWLSQLMAEEAATAAEHEARARAEALEAEHRRLLVEERVQHKLLAGKRRFHGEDLEVVEQWAFYAAKDLIYSGDGEVGELDTAVLRAVGVDANDHTTWPFHCGGCDGLGAANCAERVAQMAAQRFEELEADRLARRERSRRDAECIASGAFIVGQPVLAYYDSRAAVVVKVNKVTVKVRHIGWNATGYELVERNYSPTYLHNLSAGAAEKAAAIAVGQRVEFTDGGGAIGWATSCRPMGRCCRWNMRCLRASPAARGSTFCGWTPPRRRRDGGDSVRGGAAGRGGRRGSHR
jgi:hypothetical protein